MKAITTSILITHAFTLPPLVAFFMTHSTKSAAFITSLYSHFYIYPILFMPWLALAAYRSIRLLRPIFLEEHILKRFLILAAVFLAISVGSYFETQTEKPAIFELPPEIINQAICSHKGKDIKINDYVRLAHTKSSEQICSKEFNEIISSFSPSKQTPTAIRNTYIISVFFQITLWTTTLTIFVYAFSLFLRRNSQYIARRPQIIDQLIIMLLSGTPWVVWRFAFENHRADIYSALVIEHPVAILGICFVLAGIYLSIMSTRVTSALSHPALGAASAIGILGLLSSKDWLERLFPVAPSYWHYLLLTVVSAMVFGLVLLLRHEKGEKGHPNHQ